MNQDQFLGARRNLSGWIIQRSSRRSWRKKCRSNEGELRDAIEKKYEEWERNEEMKFHCENRLTEISDRFQHRPESQRESSFGWIFWSVNRYSFKWRSFCAINSREKRFFFHLSRATIALHTRKVNLHEIDLEKGQWILWMWWNSTWFLDFSAELSSVNWHFAESWEHTRARPLQQLVPLSTWLLARLAASPPRHCLSLRIDSITL